MLFYSLVFVVVEFCDVWVQVVTVGVVGGSDLIKISEQLGSTG